jgi:hypothetical protein
MKVSRSQQEHKRRRSLDGSVDEVNERNATEWLSGDKCKAGKHIFSQAAPEGCRPQ